MFVLPSIQLFRIALWAGIVLFMEDVAAVLFLILVGLIWAISSISESISKSQREARQRAEFKKKRDEKYGGRIIDKSKSLYERNKDIIAQFEAKIKPGYHGGGHYFDDLVRDCINEICLAEERMQVAPNNNYLYRWETTAPSDLKMLSATMKSEFEILHKRLDRENREKEMELARIEREKIGEIRRIEREKREEKKRVELQKVIEIKKTKERIIDTKLVLNEKIGRLLNPKDILKIRKYDRDKKTLNIQVIKEVLQKNEQSWSEKEREILNRKSNYKEFPLFESVITLRELDQLNDTIRGYNDDQKRYSEIHHQNKQQYKKVFDGYTKGEAKDIETRINYIISNIELPDSLPKLWEVSFDPQEKIAIIDLKLPDVVHTKFVKSVQLKTVITEKPLNKKELSETVPSIQPAIILRVAFEIFKNDFQKTIALLVINGWVEYDDPSTGKRKKTYTSSIALTREQIVEMNIAKIDPLTAFMGMSGKSAGKLIDIIPVVPVLSLNKKDSRFIETKRVMNGLETTTNLAAMDWQDFESLIAELFEREFAKEGVEIKVTQASRDRGVDAVVFDPDPIKGGKFVIQAKRYTNTVDVSAVRDLCAVVKKEGASRGIIVTTSSYGADAYEFAKNEPVTLLNGGELLGLLQKHGYNFRIDLKEARKLNLAAN